MLRRLSVVLLLLLAGSVGTVAALQATTRDTALSDARANYERHVERLVQCLADSGYEAEATRADNGIFYNVDFDFPPADSIESWDASHNAYIDALDACASEELLRATAAVEALVRPSDEDIRKIAETCAPGNELASASEWDVEDLLAGAASTSPEVAHCIVTAMHEHARSLVSP